MKTSLAAMFLATAMLVAPAAALAVPPPAIAGSQPQQPTDASLVRISALMQQCHAAISGAHPWRASQASREMFQLKLSMSYRSAADRLSERERAGAAAIETRAYRNLAATCAPLLV